MSIYNLLTVWKFDAPLEKVYNTVRDTDYYHLWWKGQSKVETLHQGDALGVGAVKKFRTRSMMPYSLNYTGTVQYVEPFVKVVGTTTGELEGTGTWIFEQTNGITTVEYYWIVKTNSVLMNFLTPIMRPVFEWNHDVVMRWGAEGLAKYLGCKFING